MPGWSHTPTHPQQLPPNPSPAPSLCTASTRTHCTYHPPHAPSHHHTLHLPPATRTVPPSHASSQSWPPTRACNHRLGISIHRHLQQQPDLVRAQPHAGLPLAALHAEDRQAAGAATWGSHGPRRCCCRCCCCRGRHGRRVYPDHTLAGQDGIAALGRGAGAEDRGLWGVG